MAQEFLSGWKARVEINPGTGPIAYAVKKFSIKLKRPQGQYSVYDDHAKDPTPKQDAPPPSTDAAKPN